MYVAYVGNLFLRMLKALILPLIIPSLIAAVGSLDMSLSGKVFISLMSPARIPYSIKALHQMEEEEDMSIRARGGGGGHLISFPARARKLGKTH